MQPNILGRVLVFSAAVGLLLEVAPASAQIEEIIVTARKREESILKVPVNTSVLAGQQLTQYGIADLNRIVDNVPGLYLAEANSGWGGLVTLHGIGTTTLNATIDQSVSLNLDGMQLTQGVAYQSAFFDMAQVEVLKGPQALFFGKASPGGVISVRTNDPTDEFELFLTGGYEFEAEEKIAELIISGPLTDTLKARLAGRFSDQEGYFSNDAVAAPVLGALDPKYDKASNNEYYLIRGTLLWDPTDRFSARFKVNASEDDTQGTTGGYQIYSCPDGTATLLPLPADFLGGEDCQLDDQIKIVDMNPADFPDIKNGGVPFSEIEQLISSLEMDYSLTDELLLTSVTGVYDLENDTLINGNATSEAGPFIAIGTELERDDFTQELRLTSNSDGRLNFMAGAFYQDASMDYLVDIIPNQTFVPLAPFPIPPKLALVQHEVEIETLSLFGQLLFQITPEVEVGIGTRWTDEEREHTQTTLAPPVIGVTPLATPKISSSKWSPEASLSYTPTDDLTFYANIKQAYKSGSFDSSGQFSPGDEASFGDERVRGGAAGIKSRWLDDSLAINLAAYYYKYKDLQVATNDFDPLTSSIVIHTVNAPAAEVYGFDLDITYTSAAIDGLTLFGALNYNHARYDDFDEALCWGGQTISDGCDRVRDTNPDSPTFGLFTRQDLSDESLVNAPDWSANIGFDYERPVAGDMTLRIGMNSSYSDEYLVNILAREDMWLDSYFKTNASISLIGRDNGWEISLIGNNLTDEVTSGLCPNADFQNAALVGTISGAPTAPLGSEEMVCTAERGREIWLRFTVRPLVLMNK